VFAGISTFIGVGAASQAASLPDYAAASLSANPVAIGAVGGTVVFLLFCATRLAVGLVRFAAWATAARAPGAGADAKKVWDGYRSRGE
jgi:hypothetical protein